MMINYATYAAKLRPHETNASFCQGAVVDGVSSVRAEHAIVQVSLHVRGEHDGARGGKGLLDDGGIDVFAHENFLEVHGYLILLGYNSWYNLQSSGCYRNPAPSGPRAMTVSKLEQGPLYDQSLLPFAVSTQG